MESNNDIESFLKRALSEAEETLEICSATHHDGNLDNSSDIIDRLAAVINLYDDITSLLLNIEQCPETDPIHRPKWTGLCDVFQDLKQELIQAHQKKNENVCLLRKNHHVLRTNSPGRPKFDIPKETLQELRGLNFSWNKIASMFGVSRWTVACVDEFGLSYLQQFSAITDDEIDNIVKSYIERHVSTTGEPFLSGHFLSLGLHIQRRRIRASLNRIDPRNVALRWGALVFRRKYYVPWPNSLWHIDGHHSLIRWKFVIHGCCDGFSRKIVFLKCSTNNLATTVMGCFEEALQKHYGLLPSRIRVDHGVENVLICDAMVERRGEGRHSFIAGPSTCNQRIERLWRDVYRCVCHFFYYHFYGMEQTGILDLENPLHVFALHTVYTPRINFSLDEFSHMFNNHRLRTEHNLTPNQIWLNGMVDERNPLASNIIENTVDVVDEFFGEDPEARCGDNNVVIDPIDLENKDELKRFVYENIDVNRASCEAGIDVYVETLDLLLRQLDEE